jgi:hypothetical protein
VSEINQVTKEKSCQIKGRATSTLGAAYEKPHKNDEVEKDEAQYDVAQEEYDFGVGSILEQLKHKAVEFFGTMQQKINEIAKNVQEKVGEAKDNVGSTIDEIK